MEDFEPGYKPLFQMEQTGTIRDWSIKSGT